MDGISQLGIGGALVLLALAQMFAFLKSRKNGNGRRCPLELQVELWESRLSDAIGRSVSKALEPHFIAENEMLKTMIGTLGGIAGKQTDILLEQARLKRQE